MVEQSVIRAIRRRRRRLREETRLAYLGDQDGRVAVPGRTGYVYVRYPAGSDSGGAMVLSPAVAVRSSIGAGYLPRAGARVRVGRDFEGVEAVVSADFNGLIEAGVNPIVTNPIMPEARFISNDNYTPLMAQPVGTHLTVVPRVTVYSWFYDLGTDAVGWRRGTDDTASKPDLSAFVPSPGQHRYATLWLDAVDGTFHVTTSTAKATTVEMTVDDLSETFLGRPPDGVPIKAFYLEGGKPLVQRVEHVDLRGLVNTPALLGYQNPVVVASRVNDGFALLVMGDYDVSASLDVRGVLNVV